jgi:hypothetical protein
MGEQVPEIDDDIEWLRVNYPGAEISPGKAFPNITGIGTNGKGVLYGTDDESTYVYLQFLDRSIPVKDVLEIFSDEKVILTLSGPFFQEGNGDSDIHYVWKKVSHLE